MVTSSLDLEDEVPFPLPDPQLQAPSELAAPEPGKFIDTSQTPTG
jgi:hypothetical protein